MKPKRRILFFVENYAFPTYTFIYNEIQYLSRNNDVLVLTTRRINEDLFEFNNVIEVPFYGNNLDYKIRKTLRSLDFSVGSTKCSFKKRIRETIETFKPEVIHCHFGFESWLFLNNYPVNDSIPVFLHFHGFDASHKLNSKRYCSELIKHFARKDLYPIFVSKFMHLNVENSIKQKVKKWFLLYYGTDCSFFKRENPSTDKSKLTFLQISSFAEKKGQFYTVMAFNKFIKNNAGLNCRLILAGEGTEKSNVQNLVIELGLSELVSFPGLVNREEAKSLMENAHFFVHHSVTSNIGDTEGIPNAIMEAMAMELPVISTYHSGIPELVENGVNGFLVPEKDVDAFAEAMENILSWNYIPENRIKIEELFEKERHGALLESYYTEALEEMKKNSLQLS